MKPLYERLKKRVQATDICHADETPLRVLNEPNRTPQQKSYMWLFRTGKYAEHPAIVCEYHETRKAEHPKTFFRDFKGYVHADSYAGYHNLPEGVTVVGYMAHARRKFDEALKAISVNNRASSQCHQLRRKPSQRADMESSPTDENRRISLHSVWRDSSSRDVTMLS